MSFTFNEVINSVFSALVYGFLFSAFWMIASVCDFAIIRFFGVVGFFVGFMLLSYLCLDGMIRLYMLLLSLSSFLLSKKYIFDKIFIFFRKMMKAVGKIPIFGKDKEVLPLDKEVK